MLQANSLTKRYGDQVALQDLNLQVAPGDIYCLLGANGAGKSTTINLFLGFLQPDGGEALIGGQSVQAYPLETKRQLAYIPENLSLYPQLSGLENPAYFSGLAGKNYSQAQLGDFLAEAGLQGEAHARRVGAYSKGMRQKVGIALALAKQAQVLLLDEPTSGLDPQASHEFAQLLTRLQSQGVAVLMATHDLFRAQATGTRVGILRQGQLVHERATADTTLDELEALYLETVAISA